MFTLYLFIFLVYLNSGTHTQDLEVVSSGISKLKQNDMIVSFFLSVQHHGDKPRRLMATMVECCENFAEGDQDCDLIDLFGGDFGIIQPGSLRNFTMIYPNLYGYNRRGYCLVNILHRSLGHPDIREIHHRIDFDTRLSTEAVPYVLEGWYDPSSLILCETPDLDPLDHCNPVDCHLKYSGYRNYYNQKMKLCQRSPICLTDVDKDLPDIVYIPTNNKCRDLEAPITKDDIAKLMQSDATSDTSSRMVDIRCHHGEINPRTGLCICDRGWKSEPFDADSYIPGKTIYSMCTIQCPQQDNNKFMPALAGLIIAMWMLFLVFCCEKNNIFGGKSKSSGTSSPRVVYYPLQGSTPSSPSESLDNRKENNGSLKKWQGPPYATQFSTAVLKKKPLLNTKKRLFLFEKNI